MTFQTGQTKWDGGSNKSYIGLAQYVLIFKTYQLEISTSMIKTNHLNWYVIIVFADEMSNFITNYELKSKFTKNLWFIYSMIKSHKSHTIHLIDYTIMSKYSCYHYFR